MRERSSAHEPPLIVFTKLAGTVNKPPARLTRAAETETPDTT
jgi:hypothetical protein